METFNPIHREYIAPVDLTTLGRTYDTLEQGHKDAVQATSALKQAIAQYDLNNAESEWRQSKINEVQNILANNTRFGNSAGAVDDLMAASGDILFGADMQGRIKRQQAWKENNAKIDKMVMPEDYKRIFKELNPYGTYVDKYDDYGNVIEGEVWKPNVNPVNTVPLNEILNNALKWAAKESGGGSSVMFLDANGNPTSDITKSITGEMYSNTTGKWEKLSREKIAAAIEASINSIPGARESLRQDYEIAKWKFNHNEESDITDNNGVVMTPNEYLASKLNPFYKAATYYNSSSQTTYGDAWKAQLQLTRQGAYGIGASESDGSNPNIDPIQGRSNPIVFKNRMPIQAQQAINSSKQVLADAMKSLGIDKDISEMDSDAIRNNISKLATPAERLQALQALSDLEVNTQYIESIRESIKQDKDKLDKFDAYVAITSLKTGDSDNPYIKQYNAAVNKTFDGAKSIGQGFADEDTYQQFITNIGGEKKAKELGIQFNTINGKKYAILPKESAQSLHVFTKAVNDAYNQTHSTFGKAWNNFKNMISPTWGDNTIKINEDGSIHYNNMFDRELNDFNSNPGYMLNRFSPSGRIIDSFGDTGFIPNYTAENAYSDTNNLMRNLQVNYDNTLDDGGNLSVSNNIMAQATPDMAELAGHMKKDPTNASHYKAVYELAEDEIKNTIGNIDLVQHGGYIINDNNTLVKPTTNEAMEITQAIRNAKNNDINMVGAQDPETGNWGVQVTLKVKDDKPVVVFVPNIDNSTYERWNRKTDFRAKNDILTYSAANRPFQIVDDTYNLPSVTLVPYGKDTFAIKDKDGKVESIIDDKLAIHYRDLYYQYKDFQKIIMAGYTVKEEAVNDRLNAIATSVAELYGTPTESNINYIKQQLIKFATKNE